MSVTVCKVNINAFNLKVDILVETSRYRNCNYLHNHAPFCMQIPLWAQYKY